MKNNNVGEIVSEIKLKTPGSLGFSTEEISGAIATLSGPNRLLSNQMQGWAEGIAEYYRLRGGAKKRKKKECHEG